MRPGTARIEDKMSPRQPQSPLTGRANLVEEPRPAIAGSRKPMTFNSVRRPAAQDPRAMAATAQLDGSRDAAERAKAGLSIAEPTSLLGVDPNKDPAIFLPGRTRR